MRWRATDVVLTNGPFLWLVILAGCGFVASFALSDAASVPALCGMLERVDLGELSLVLGPQWSPAGALLGWLVMLLAMMPPLLAQPALHVWRSSLVSRRPRATLIFAFGYATIWLGAGFVLIAAAIVAGFYLRSGAQIAALCLALAWSCSPSAQAARNSCHRMRRIAVFGRRADRDCLRFGITIGTSCLLTCWPWMLLVMLFDAWHAPVMVVTTLFLFAERIAPPAPEAWRLPPALRLVASVAAPQKVLGRL